MLAPTLLLACILALFPTSVMAQLLPLWEAGLGIASIYMPDYRGSKHYRMYALPFPYMVYRGDKLRLDRQGLRGVFFDTERVYLDFSAAASAPVDSSDNDLRAGMPDLDPALQLGPSLKINVWGREETRKFINIALPVRKVVVTNFSRYEAQGYLANPLINLNYGRFHPYEWNLGLAYGPIYTDRQYHDYYYSVSSRYATDERPEYHARSGFSGTRLTLTASTRRGKYWIAGFAIYDNLANSVIRDSPLVEANYSFLLGLTASWLFGKSDIMVVPKD